MIIDATLTVNGEHLSDIPFKLVDESKWGRRSPLRVIGEGYETPPEGVELTWVSVLERKAYHAQIGFDKSVLKELLDTPSPHERPLFTDLVITIAHGGKVAVWLHGILKQIRLHWAAAEEIALEELFPDDDSQNDSIDKWCDEYLSECSDEERSRLNSLDALPFDRMMTQYCYRLMPLMEHWQPGEAEWQHPADDEENVPVVDHIYISRHDGTHHKLADDTLTRHHMAGRPERIAMAWHAGKNEWSAHMWLDEELTASIFERLYGTHRDTRVDLILHFDPIQRHYELALFRYGMTQPQLLPPECWQIIVFKDQFEHYRSENYNQPSDAWRW